jgi:hypothetical protein
MTAVGRGGMPIIAWEETAPGGRRIKLWRGAAVEDLGAGTYPAVSVSDGRAIVAWAARRDGREELAVRRF